MARGERPVGGWVDGVHRAALGLLGVLVSSSVGDACAQVFDFTSPAPVIAVGDSPRGVAVADFDGNGVPDLATANFNSDDVTILLGLGGGSFAAPVTIGGGNGPSSLVAGDFDGDGTPDLAIASRYANIVLMQIGQGDGSFAVGNGMAMSSGQVPSPVSVAAGDMDGDGDLDLAAANAGDHTLGVRLNYGNAYFDQPVTYAATGSFLSTVLLADVDADGVLDLLSSESAPAQLTLRLGLGGGVFGAGLPSITGNSPRTIAVGDLDGDGARDLVTVNDSDDELAVLLGHGDGTFDAAVTYAVGEFPVGVVVGDFDGDGVGDLATANAIGNSVSILRGQGDGSFAAAETFAAGGGAFALAASDLDGNGSTDLVVVDLDDDALTLLLNLVTPVWQGLAETSSSALAGTHAEPRMSATGSLLPGDPLEISLTNALENTTAWLTVGFAELNAPFKGGTLVPDINPPGFVLPLPTGPAGAITINATWPAGVPSAFTTHYQYWISDRAGPVGFSASNAIGGTTP